MVRAKSTKILSLIMAVVMAAALSCVFCFDRAYAETDGEWQYTVVGGNVDITGYIGTSTNITVPAKVDGKNVYSVSALFNNSSKRKVTAVTISSGIKALGNGVFSDYTALTRITLPDTLTTVSANAFYGCIGLTGIKLPYSVTTIGESAFMNCTSLISADLTCRASEIPAKIFDGCTKLATVTLPPYITGIGASAFNNCGNLNAVTIPESVKSIGSNAFANCTKLASISFPAELKTIDEAAFTGCSLLTTVFLPNKVKTISEGSFRGCTNLKEVYVSPSVNMVKTDAFYGCTNLQRVIFGGEYVKLSGVFDVSSIPEVYYAVKYASSWDTYTGKKQSYNAVASMTITGKTSLNEGAKMTVSVTAKPTSCQFGDIYTLTSSNTNVATVSRDGIVTAKSAGTATITATSINGTTGTLSVKVVPSAPTGLTVTPKSTSSVDISWKSTGAAGYYIYRSTKKSSGYKKIDTALTTSYVDKGLTKGKTYYYKVVAYVTSDGKKIESATSKVASVKVTSPTPTSVSATKSKRGVATVKWSKSAGASGYEVYMAKSSGGKYSLVKRIASGSTLSYKKTGLTAGKTYYFKVRSYIVVNGTKVYSPFTKVVKVKV